MDTTGRTATFLGDALATLGGGLMGHMLLREGGQWKLNPDFIKAHAPHEYMKGKRGFEEQWGAVVNALTSDEQDVILHQLMIDSTLSEAQQADLIIHVSELSLTGQTPEEKRANFANAVKRLKRLADGSKSNEWRVEELDSLNWIKNPSTEYILVRLENAGVSLDHAANHLAHELEVYNSAVHNRTQARRASGGFSWDPQNTIGKRIGRRFQNLLSWLRRKIHG